jgi:hypothetical protein
VRGKIFATLGYPDEGWGMVSLSPTDQQLLVLAAPDVFVPAKGAWGRRGATGVLLGAAKKSTVREALAAAWRKTAPKTLGKTNVESRPRTARTTARKAGKNK